MREVADAPHYLVDMPDRNAAFLVVHRAARGRTLFESEQDYWAYLDLLRRGILRAEVSLAAWCLLADRVAMVVVPRRLDSIAALTRLVDARYAHYCNIRFDRQGAVWAGRPQVEALLGGFELLAILHTETVSGVRPAEDYGWSSAGSHVMGSDALGLLDLDLTRLFGEGEAWSALLEAYTSGKHGKAVAA